MVGAGAIGCFYYYYYFWIWIYRVAFCVRSLKFLGCWDSLAVTLGYIRQKRKYKELLVLAKRNCPIPPKAFLLQLRNPGHNTTNEHKKTLRKGAKKKINFLGMANLTATRELCGFLHCLPYISQTKPCKNLQTRTANKHREKNKLHKKLDILSQRTRKRRTSQQKSLGYYHYYPNQPREKLHHSLTL